MLSGPPVDGAEPDQITSAVGRDPGRLFSRMQSGRVYVVSWSLCFAAALAVLLVLGAAGADAGIHQGRAHKPSGHRTVPGAGLPVFTRVLKVDSARYTGPGTTTLFVTKTLSVTVSAKADDLHDTLLVYAINRPCASRYQAAINQTRAIEQTTGGVSELTDVDLGANPGPGTTVRQTGRYAYRYTLTNPQVAPGMTTLCAMLYDSPGDPRYPGNPHNIPTDHVWQTAKAPIR
jgi:hypothetical protein